MEHALSPLNQGLHPIQAAPLWLALQPYANARLCLFEVDRPGSKEPVPIRRHVIDCFLEQRGIVSGYNYTAITIPGDVILSGYLCRAAVLPVSTSNTFDWLAAELEWTTPGFRGEVPLPWDPALLGTVQAPCEGVMWLGDLALLSPEGGLPNGGRAQFAGCLPATVQGQTLLLGAGGEDHRAVGVTAITELTIAIEGIDVAPVGPQQHSDTGAAGIEAHPHTLLMTRAAGRHLTIGGLGQHAAAVPTLDVQHARQRLQIVLQAPEAATRQHQLLGAGRGLDCRGHGGP